MPSSKGKLCSKHGCMTITDEKYCEAHRNQAWRYPSGSPASRGYDHKWRKLAKRIRTRDLHLCQECLRNGQYEYGSQVDHIIPKVKGGTDDDDNLQTLCEYHHRVKSSRESKESRS